MTDNLPRIFFAVFDEVEELDLVGPWEFAGLLAAMGHAAPSRLVSLNNMTPTAAHGMRLSADLHFSEAPLPDVLIVPGGRGARVTPHSPDALAWLRRCAEGDRTVMSICTGSYLMQAAGLFTGRRAVTHWAFLDHLRDDPEVTLVEERVVHDGNIWSSGGVSSGMDMMLAFIAHRFGDEVAAKIQLYAEYFPNSRIYGAPQERGDVTAYIRALGRDR